MKATMIKFLTAIMIVISGSYVAQDNVDSLLKTGESYQIKGEYIKALDFYERALKLSKSKQDIFNVPNSLMQLGELNRLMQNQDVALDHFFKAYKEFVEINHPKFIERCLTGIARVYCDKKSNDSAIMYFERALVISDSLGEESEVNAVLNNLGVIYQNQGNYNKALEYYNIGLERAVKNDDKLVMSALLNNIGFIYQFKGDQIKAIEYANKALELAKSINHRDRIRDIYNALWAGYYRAGKYKESIEYYQMYVNMRDTIMSDDVKRASDKQAVEFKYEKQKALDEKEHQARLAVAAEKEQKDKIFIRSIIVCFILVLIFAMLIARSLSVTRKQKKEIEFAMATVNAHSVEIIKQKAIVEEQHKDITDSVNYAKHIQTAILPSLKRLEDDGNPYFLIYKPKNVVAGDFYWMEKVDDITFVAVADSTGHGIPGAILSVVCSNALSRVVNEYGILEPGKMLDKARQLITETLNEGTQVVQDGMDISLAAINTKTLEVKWAGANNPLLYRHKYILKEILADKQTVGYTEDPKLFTTHTLQLEKGDKLFLFTDGFADQFGGENNKKYKYANFLIDIEKYGHLSGSQLKAQMEKVFENWKGSNEQTDDVCLIGIEI